MPISTQDLKLLPDVNRLRALLQSLAMLDAILSPEWESRYYSFNSSWATGEQMGSMRNGSGDDFFALFNAGGCFLKGFAHESPMSPYSQNPKRIWPGVLNEVPVEFAACLKELAFKMEDTTFCIWRRLPDKSWQHGPIDFPDHPDPDGSQLLLSLLDAQPKSYASWAKDYYERPVSLPAVRHVYAQKPLTEKLIGLLNPDISLEELIPDIQEIGYPLK